jgi:hypothetical protein
MDKLAFQGVNQFAEGHAFADARKSAVLYFPMLSTLMGDDFKSLVD